MKKKLIIDEKIEKLNKEIIEQIVNMVNSVKENELRLERDLKDKPYYIKKVTSTEIIIKSQTLFSSFKTILLEDVPFFILLDIMDCCEFYLDHYQNQKEYEKNALLVFLKGYKHDPIPCERIFQRLMRKTKKKYPYFIFYEQRELLIRDWLEYYN
jgi:hypothetical protein